MTRRIWLAIVAVLGVVGLLQGQDKAPPSNYEHLKTLEWLIGEYKREWTAEKDWGAVKKGDKMTFVATGKWALNKNAIVTSHKLNTPSVTVFESAGMIGWDRATKQIIASGFDSAGGHFMSSWSFKEGKWYVKSKGSNPWGKPISGTRIFSEITKTSFVSQWIDGTVGGKKQPDREKSTMTRVK
jgi:hypothetical protein